MSWISGSCNEEPERDEEQQEPRPRRMIWGQGTHFAGIVDRVNPGHFGQGPTRSDEAEDH